jgi:hypothetical protein
MRKTLFAALHPKILKHVSAFNAMIRALQRAVDVVVVWCTAIGEG